jgi:hypothetical protein
MPAAAAAVHQPSTTPLAAAPAEKEAAARTHI